MLKNTDIQNFLTRHRAKLNPEEFGFSPKNRRVKGLRREEVAQLAAVSVSWYTWLEQGRDIRISPAALKRIGKVLQLSGTELSYLEGMVLGGNESRKKDVILPREITAMVDGLNPHPAFIRNDVLDILYWNDSAKESIFDWSTISEPERNSIKLLFLNPDYRKKYMTGKELQGIPFPHLEHIMQKLVKHQSMKLSLTIFSARATSFVICGMITM